MSKGNRNRKLRELDPALPFDQWPPWLRQLVNEHARRLTRELIDQYEIDADACTLWVLHQGFGWGEKRLRQFFDTFIRLHRELRQRYEQSDVGTWVCLEELKKIGVDVEAWNRETGP